MKDTTELNLTELAAQELRPATSAIGAGDEEVRALAAQITQSVDRVLQLTREARIKADALRANDVMNPEGRARLLAAIPGELKAATEKLLEEADLQTDVAEGRHRYELLRHNTRDDFALISELRNFALSITNADASVRLAELAANPRYASIMAGPFGESLAARFRLRDASGLTRAAIQGLATNGTDSQRARAAALDKFGAVRRAIGLARGGRDAAAEQIAKPMEFGGAVLR